MTQNETTTDNIVNHLRAVEGGKWIPVDLAHRAANEIERLRIEVAAMREKYYRRDDELADLRRRIGEALSASSSSPVAGT